MGKQILTLVKAILVNKKESLSVRFEKWYYPDEDCYVFFSITQFDRITGSFQGKLKLHDKLALDLGLPTLPSNCINYVSVDISRNDRDSTYLSTNSRYYHLTPAQVALLVNLFNVDIVSSKMQAYPNTF